MLSHRSRILALVAAVVPFVGVHAVQAADFAGSVGGVVKSASGEALAGAYVKLTNPEKRLTFMIVSQAQGRYTMNNLPPGDYTVQGIGNGFQSKPTKVALTADKPATADVSLTDKQAEVPNGWIRSPGRVAGNELDHELAPPNLPEGEGKEIMERPQPPLVAVRYQEQRVHRLSGASRIQGPDDRQQHASRPEWQDGLV